MLSHTDSPRRAAALLAVCLLAAGVAAPLDGQTVEGQEGGDRRRGGALGPGRPAPTPTPEPEDARPADPGDQDAPRGRGGALGPHTPSALQPPPESLAPADVTGGIALEEGEDRFGVAASAGVLTGRPTVRPPVLDEPPNIDGRLDDEAWAVAAHITEFVQISPLDGAPGSEATEVFIAYDNTNIYLGFHAHYANPDMLRANRSDRDRTPGDDAFVIYIDPFLDQQRAYVFSVNAYGVQGDAILSARSGGGFGGGGGDGGPRGFFGPPRGDRTWDTLFESGGRVVQDGFTAEMAIPFKSLRYPRRGGNRPHRWGLQIARRIRGKNETVVWSPVHRDVAGFLPQMGVLDGMTGLSTSRNIEILPTFTAVQFGSLDAAGSFRNDRARPEGGVNFKYGVTSNLTADVTYNPDFSQIESDRPQIEVNQRFDLFYPELRPFFLEGAEIFQFRGPVNLVHTRTIVDPRYGAKLTGKAGNTTIGVMYANDEAPGYDDEVIDRAAGQSAQTFVGRMRYDLYSESYVGAIVTSREFAGSSNQVAGLDSNFRLGNTHSFGVRAVGTQDTDLDGLETSGFLIDASIRSTGRNLSYFLAHYALSPEFQTDVGFVRRTDQRATFGNIGYAWWPENWIVSWGPSITYMRGHNFGGILDDEQYRASVNFSFMNNIRFDADLRREMERFGGINFHKTRFSYMGVSSASRRLSFGIGSNGGDQVYYDEERPYLGRDFGWRGFLNLRFVSRWSTRINIDTNRFVNVTARDADELVFDVNIFRAMTTYQFTDRLLFRNISEYHSFDQRLNLNFLLTYRINAGTVFYVGYDDRYQQGDLIERDANGDGIDDRYFPTTSMLRTNRAFFTKLQYLFRY